MTHHVRVRAGLGSWTLFIGPGAALVPAFRALGVQRRWDSIERGWWVRTANADDVVAYLEHRGRVLIDLEQVEA